VETNGKFFSTTRTNRKGAVLDHWAVELKSNFDRRMKHYTTYLYPYYRYKVETIKKMGIKNLSLIHSNNMSLYLTFNLKSVIK
jgi:hypothetical protein